jgi:hypothetical protein
MGCVVGAHGQVVVVVVMEGVSMRESAVIIKL